MGNVHKLSYCVKQISNNNVYYYDIIMTAMVSSAPRGEEFSNLSVINFVYNLQLFGTCVNAWPYVRLT